MLFTSGVALVAAVGSELGVTGWQVLSADRVQAYVRAVGGPPVGAAPGGAVVGVPPVGAASGGTVVGGPPVGAASGGAVGPGSAGQPPITARTDVASLSAPPAAAPTAGVGAPSSSAAPAAGLAALACAPQTSGLGAPPQAGPVPGGVPGGLTVGLAAVFLAELLEVSSYAWVDYGLDRVRFPAALPVGAAVRARGTLVDARALDRAVRAVVELRYENDAGGPPPCVAHVVTLLLPR